MDITVANYCVHKSPTVLHTLSPINPAHILLINSFKFQFSIIFPSAQLSSKLSLSFTFCDQIFHTSVTHLILLPHNTGRGVFSTYFLQLFTTSSLLVPSFLLSSQTISMLRCWAGVPSFTSIKQNKLYAIIFLYIQNNCLHAIGTISYFTMCKMATAWSWPLAFIKFWTWRMHGTLYLHSSMCL
jgi:hypothetical protein